MRSLILCLTIIAAPIFTNDNDDANCPVCMEQFDDEFTNPVVLNCGHGLCATCTATLLSHHVTGARCPLCRRTIERVDGCEVYSVHDIEDNEPAPVVIVNDTLLGWTTMF